MYKSAALHNGIDPRSSCMFPRFLSCRLVESVQGTRLPLVFNLISSGTLLRRGSRKYLVYVFPNHKALKQFLLCHFSPAKMLRTKAAESLSIKTVFSTANSKQSLNCISPHAFSPHPAAKAGIV